jgi:beta-xylosidase
VHLEPVGWADDWPVMGNAPEGATTGEPAMEHALPVALHPQPTDKPQTSDEFDAKTLSPKWEWNHNPVNERWSLGERPGFLRLHTAYSVDLLHARNTITECLQDEAAEITVLVDLEHLAAGDRAGLSIFDVSESYVAVVESGTGRKLVFSNKDNKTAGPDVMTQFVQWRGTVVGDVANYSYSIEEGATFHPIGGEVKLAFGWWKGAHPAVFAFNTDAAAKTNGFVDIDRVRYRPLPHSL